MADKELNFREFIESSPSHAHQDWEVAHLYNYNQDLTVRKIAHMTGRSIRGVYKAIKNFGGYKNRMASDHDTVKLYANSGLNPKEIAERTPYSHRQVKRILGGK